MVYPLHLRLATRLSSRWSALLIGLVGVAVLLVPMVIGATSLTTCIYPLVSGLQNNTLGMWRTYLGAEVELRPTHWLPTMLGSDG